MINKRKERRGGDIIEAWRCQCKLRGRDGSGNIKELRNKNGGGVGR